MFKILKIVLPVVILVSTGCDLITSKDKDYRPDIAVLTGISLLKAAIIPIDKDACLRCDGQGYYYIRDTGVKQICEECGGTGKGDMPEVYVEPPIKIESAQVPIESEINWVPMHVAQHNGKITYVHFVSNGCAPCMALERDAFQQPEVIGLTKDVNCVQVHVPSDRSIIWGVRKTPTDIWLNTRWKIVGRQNPPGSDYFAAYFKKWKDQIDD